MAIISQKLIKLLNYRIEQEEYSSRLYKAMSVWLNIAGYTGASDLWKKYSEEEMVHVNWAYEYLLDLNIKPIVPNQIQPQAEFNSLPNIIALSYRHEIEITNQCQELAKIATEEGDYMTLELAQKYLMEQKEEISKTTTWIDKLTAFGDDPIALRLLDNEMGELANG